MKIVFAGNPNTGKTALINAIAKSDLEVGNWPGVTVEKKEAKMRYKGEELTLVDLPGSYTLSPYSLEEKVTRNVLSEGDFDAVVNVVNVTNLRRNLYLTLELVDMQRPMVIALNMFDDFKKRGFDLDFDLLEEILGVSVIPTIAPKGLGAKRVLDAFIKATQKKKIPHIQPYQEHIEKEIAFLMHRMEGVALPPRLFALKLIAEDPYAFSLAKKLERDDLVQAANEARCRLEKHMNLPIKTIISHARYEVIDRILEQTLKKPIVDKVLLSEKIDNIVLHKWLGLPLFFFVMLMVFKLTFDGSTPLVEWIGGFFQDFVGKYITLELQNSAPHWVVSLLVDGILSGAGLVLSFLPLLFLLYLFMALLEESGYMARVSFLLDRAGRALGIRGSAFISMIIGFGCNVPAVYATRSLTTRRERLITILMIPLMSCSARLPIYALFTAIFFVHHQVWIIMALYLIGIVFAILLGWIANRVLPAQQSRPFLLELPTYHLPNRRAVWVLMRPKLKDFIVKAGTLIVLASAVLWSVINLPVGTTPQESYLARIAKEITPLFKPAGFGGHWELIAALIPGTLAKEVVIGSLGTIYGTETKKELSKNDFYEDLLLQAKSLKQAVVSTVFNLLSIQPIQFENSMKPTVLEQKLRSQFSSPLAAFSYLIFVLLYIPCVSTMVAIKAEMGTRWMLLEVAILPLLAYTASVIFYQAASLILRILS